VGQGGGIRPIRRIHTSRLKRSVRCTDTAKVSEAEPFGAIILVDGGDPKREAYGAELAKLGLTLEVEGTERGGRR
jgi:hypothetical protein